MFSNSENLTLRQLIKAFRTGKLTIGTDQPRKPLQPPQEFAIGKIVADIAPGGTGTATIWRYDADSTAEAATTLIATVRDWLSQGFTAGDKVLLGRQPNQYGVNWYPVQSAADRVQWGKAAANWGKVTTYPSQGGKAFVIVHPCDDADGTNPTAANVNVIVKVGQGCDPNIIVDQVIGYMQAEDGTFVCVTDVADDAIGMVKNFTGTVAQTPAGWACMDGGQDITKTLSGVAVDVVGRFVRGVCSDGLNLLDGGSDTATVDAHTGTGIAALLTIASAATGVTVANHADHAHTMNVTNVCWGVTASENCFEKFVDSNCDTGLQKTSGVKNPADCANSAVLIHSVSDPTHAHTISGSGTLTHNAIDTVPLYRNMRYIERIDNSA